MSESQIFLKPDFFYYQEMNLVENDVFSVSLFKFESGVSAVRLKNKCGDLVILPYQGMQIWSAKFFGRSLQMKSMFSQPVATRNYLETYGGFFIHCGMTAMGVPTPSDSHPLHGELPNAPYTDAVLAIGEDTKGKYVSLSAKYHHTVAFNTNYLAEPDIRLYENSNRFLVTMSVINLKNSPMEYMYLAHINFLPIDGGELVYSSLVDPKTIRVRRSIPSHVHPGPGYREFLEELARNPQMHHRLTPDLFFDPEVVFYIDYLSDEHGWAHTMQIHMDGSSDYVTYKPSQLDHGIRWICRTPDQDAMGMVLPATAEPEGYSVEKAKGNIKSLSAGQKFTCEIELGVLTPDETASIRSNIDRIVARV